MPCTDDTGAAGNSQNSGATCASPPALKPRQAEPARHVRDTDECSRSAGGMTERAGQSIRVRTPTVSPTVRGLLRAQRPRRRMRGLPAQGVPSAGLTASCATKHPAVVSQDPSLRRPRGHQRRGLHLAAQIVLVNSSWGRRGLRLALETCPRAGTWEANALRSGLAGARSEWRLEGPGPACVPSTPGRPQSSKCPT